jgi:predicted cytidylate kinase
MLEYANSRENVILEGRLIGALCSKNNINSLKIWVGAPVDIRAKRVCQREKSDFQDTKNKIILREKSNKKRYLMYYNIDIDDKSYYDLVINSETKSPNEIVAIILDRLNNFK